MTRQENRVAIAYDGSPAARRALLWAADEAASRNAILRIVHITPDPDAYLVGGWGAPAFTLDTAGEKEIRIEEATLLEEARAIATKRQPELKIQSMRRGGSITPALIEEANTALMLVMGARGLGSFAAMVIGSASIQVSGHAKSPVVIVHNDTPHDDHGPVVVGVDGSEMSTTALGEAYDYASRHGLPLTVLHAWGVPAGDILGYTVAMPIDIDEIESDELRATAIAMAGHAERYPDVQVTLRVTQGRAAEALIEASKTASLVVVGSHGHGGFYGTMLGSVSQAVLKGAVSPVNVVRLQKEPVS
jgi:nucleotide-binding universal stress UspA family protein